uniref:protein SYS1 homolog isoform X2 n=1 Tax=Myxine glutinosa TaxID=7769 RepID=UPI00358FA11D
MWRCVTKRDLMAGRFRSTIWDPVLIMSQIALVQSIFYSGVGLWLAMLDAMLDAPRSLQQVFRYECSGSVDVCATGAAVFRFCLNCTRIPPAGMLGVQQSSSKCCFVVAGPAHRRDDHCGACRVLVHAIGTACDTPGARTQGGSVVISNIIIPGIVYF